MVQNYFEKTGYDNPWKNPEIIKKCIQTKYNNDSYTCYYSPISQEVFWKIYDKLPEDLKEHVYFAELNKEFGKYDKENSKYYFYDFVIVKDNLKFCIEYNGDFYHANPNVYNENFLNKHMNLTAKEIWIKDEIKNNTIINEGFDLYIIWESDDIDQHIENIINIINEKVKI